MLQEGAKRHNHFSYLAKRSERCFEKLRRRRQIGKRGTAEEFPFAFARKLGPTNLPPLVFGTDSKDGSWKKRVSLFPPPPFSGFARIPHYSPEKRPKSWVPSLPAHCSSFAPDTKHPPWGVRSGLSSFLHFRCAKCHSVQQSQFNRERRAPSLLLNTHSNAIAPL